MKPGDILSAMRRTVEQLAAINEIAKALTSTLEVREVLELVMQKVSALLRPSHWSLILQDEKTGQLYFEIAVGKGAEKLKQLRLQPGEGIAGQVFLSGESRRVDDVAADRNFSKRFDEASTFQTRSLLAVPLKSRGRVVGVIELVSDRKSPPYSDEDLQTLLGIADYAAIAIDNAQNFRRVQELTITDEHTGLFNARYLQARLDQEVVRSARFKHPLSLLFLDLDRFKQVNDTHGHLAGSALLREVGELLLSCIRSVDTAHRYGGDEFAVLLVETDTAGAQVMGQRILSRFRERNFLKASGSSVKLTASIGMATFPDDAEDSRALLAAADRAMYAAKAAGKNDLRRAEQEPVKPPKPGKTNRPKRARKTAKSRAL